MFFIIALVFTFIIKIRFPKEVSIATIINNNNYYDKKEATFLFFEVVVGIRCPAKRELMVFAGKNATCAVFNNADRTSWC